MTDNELLQLAAKAINGSLDEYTDSITFDGGITYEQWQPLDDDGDALRLAVKLKFDIQQDTDNVQVWYWLIAMNNADFVTVDVGDDRFAATRLAITQAAAEIGKTR